jgi:hypothetical protein
MGVALNQLGQIELPWLSYVDSLYIACDAVLLLSSVRPVSLGWT